MPCQLLLDVQQSLFKPIVFLGPIALRSNPTHCNIFYYTANKSKPWKQPYLQNLTSHCFGSPISCPGNFLFCQALILDYVLGF